MTYIRFNSNVKVGDALYTGDDLLVRVVSVDMKTIVTRRVVSGEREEFTLRRSGIFVKKHTRESTGKHLYTNEDSHKDSHDKVEGGFECLICAETCYSSVKMSRCCGNRLCEDCLVTIATKNQKTCPFCREKFTVDEKYSKLYIASLENEVKSVKKETDVEIENLHERILRYREIKNDLLIDIKRIVEAINRSRGCMDAAQSRVNMILEDMHLPYRVIDFD